MARKESDRLQQRIDAAQGNDNFIDAELETCVRLADGFVHSYYSTDGEAGRWLADLQDSCRRLVEP